jgi:hypothetical protein
MGEFIFSRIHLSKLKIAGIKSELDFKIKRVVMGLGKECRRQAGKSFEMRSAGRQFMQSIFLIRVSYFVGQRASSAHVIVAKYFAAAFFPAGPAGELQFRVQSSRVSPRLSGEPSPACAAPARNLETLPPGADGSPQTFPGLPRLSDGFPPAFRETAPAVDGSVQDLNGSARPFNGFPRTVGGSFQSFAGSVRPFDGLSRCLGGSARRFEGFTESFYGLFRSFHGSIESFHGHLQSFHGSLERFYGLLQSFYGSVESFYGHLQSFYGPVEPFYGPVESFQSSIESFYGAVESFKNRTLSLNMPAGAVSGHFPL